MSNAGNAKDKDAAQAKVEQLIEEQRNHLEGLKKGVDSEISRIRESVQGMISEAMLKRQAAQEKRRKVGDSSDGDASGQKTKESEKMERMLKTLEENFKSQLFEL